jgi:hypothetical protein
VVSAPCAGFSAKTSQTTPPEDRDHPPHSRGIHHALSNCSIARFCRLAQAVLSGVRLCRYCVGLCRTRRWGSAYSMVQAVPAADLSPDETQQGRLPPWELAKIAAYDVVIAKMAEVSGESPSTLLGKPVAEFVAEHVHLSGGGKPSVRTVKAAMAKCKEPGWYPGKPPEDRGGRPATISKHQKTDIVRVAMELKRKKISPSPRNVRARLPKMSVNTGTEKLISDRSFQRIYRTHCYDEDEDDLWQRLRSPEQDMLPEKLKPMRVATAKHILDTHHPGSWTHYVSIDPCSTLLPKTQERLEEMEVAAFGKCKWMSKKSSRKGVNLRAPKTALTQANSTTTQVH